MKSFNIAQYKGQSFKILRQTEFSQTHVSTIKSGQEVSSQDTSRGEKIIYILEGKGTLKVGSEKTPLTPGMLITLPAKTIHSIVNNSTNDLFILNVTTPSSY